MATIRRLRGKWQAQVRRKGLAPRAKSFDNKIDAEKWARSLEAELDRCGRLPDTRLTERMTLRELLGRYLEEITPHKRSARSEEYRIKSLMGRDIAHRTLTMLSSADIAAFRDVRLKTVATSTVIRELNTLAHAIDVGRKEWGLHLSLNPVRMIRRPVPPRAINAFRKDHPLDRPAQHVGLVLFARLDVIQAAHEKQVGDLLDDLERIGDPARPEGIPHLIDL